MWSEIHVYAYSKVELYMNTISANLGYSGSCQGPQVGRGFCFLALEEHVHVVSFSSEKNHSTACNLFCKGLEPTSLQPALRCESLCLQSAHSSDATRELIVFLYTYFV